MAEKAPGRVVAALRGSWDVRSAVAVPAAAGGDREGQLVDSGSREEAPSGGARDPATSRIHQPMLGRHSRYWETVAASLAARASAMSRPVRTTAVTASERPRRSSLVVTPQCIGTDFVAPTIEVADLEPGALSTEQDLRLRFRLQLRCCQFQAGCLRNPAILLACHQPLRLPCGEPSCTLPLRSTRRDRPLPPRSSTGATLRAPEQR